MIEEIGENNLFTSYQGETERYKAAVSAFFSKATLEKMENQWREIAQGWIEFQIQEGEVNLFESVQHFSARARKPRTSPEICQWKRWQQRHAM